MPKSLQVLVALFAVVLVAELLDVAFHPGVSGPSPVPISARAYFSENQIQRGSDFNNTVFLIFLAQTALEWIVLAFLALRPPRLITRWERHPIIASGVTALLLSIAITIIEIPLAAWARQREVDVGLVKQSFGSWLIDIGEYGLVTALLAAFGFMLLVSVMRKLGTYWWIPGAVVVIVLGFLGTFLGPVVFDPLFSNYTKLKPGPVRAEVEALAKKAGVKLRGVYVQEVSNETTAANAAVIGVGSTTRVILDDTLLKSFSPAEIRAVVAHELGHVRHHDLRRGLFYFAIVAPFATLAAALMIAWIRPAPKSRIGPEVVAGAAFAFLVVIFVVTIVSNQLSRAVEASADYFSLTLTHDPKAFISAQRKLAIKGVEDPSPPFLEQFLFGTHPTPLQRIGVGVAFGRLEGNRYVTQGLDSQ